MSVLDAISQGVGAIADIANLGFGIENREYNKAMQREAWKREDTAIQRRVSDLRSAGLSPVLAAGSGASSSGPISVGTPSVDASNFMKAVEYGQAKRQNAVTEAQKNLIEEQTRATEANAFVNEGFMDMIRKEEAQGIDRPKEKSFLSLLQSMKDRIIADNKSAVLDSEIKGYNTLIAESQGVPVTTESLNSIATGKLIDNALKNPSAAASPLANIVRTFAQIFK